LFSPAIGAGACRYNISVPIRQHKSGTEAVNAFILIKQSFALAVEILEIEK
jgi:hypothetical protein